MIVLKIATLGNTHLLIKQNSDHKNIGGFDVRIDVDPHCLYKLYRIYFKHQINEKNY
jgi:hypothetical protein